MDMNKILKSIDSIEGNDTPVQKVEDTGSMKTLLESIDQIEECGMDEGPMGMPPSAAPVPQADPVTMNVTLNARGKDAIEDLLDIMKDKESSIDSHAGHDGHDGMKRLMALASDDMDGEEIEEYDNEPDPEYQDTEYMTKDIAGGDNRQKKSHPPANGGDNPMALEQSIKDELWAALTEKVTTEGRGRGKKKDKKTTEGRGKLNASRGRGKLNASRGRGKLMAGRGRGKK